MLFDYLCHKCKLWPAYTNHKFARKCSENEMSWTVFQNYLKQDHLFLKHYQRLFLQLFLKTEHKAIQQYVINSIAHYVDDELQMQTENSKFKITSTNDFEQPQLLNYTGYLYQIATTADDLSLLVALVVCTSGYYYLFQKLPPAEKTNPYYDWISYYQSNAYITASQDFVHLVNRFNENELESDYLTKLEHIFNNVVRLEKEFFDAWVSWPKK